MTRPAGELTATAPTAPWYLVPVYGQMARNPMVPFTSGAVATLPGIGIGLALGITSAFFLAAALLVFTLPDMNGQALE